MIVPWCSGSTSDFGSASLGSSPGGTTIPNSKRLIFNNGDWAYFFDMQFFLVKKKRKIIENQIL